MAKADLLNILYSKEKSPLEFHFDNLWMPSMYNYITPQDVMHLYNIASSIKNASKLELKLSEIKKVMEARGFKKFASGTNRIIYSHLEDQSFLAKIAIDKVGLRDNPAEFKNQQFLKPFVTKTFETSLCGTIATVERVQPITSKQEFVSIAGDVFELLNKLIGEYILQDVGSDYFLNYGLRNGFGPVLLDYSYLYKLDGNKLYCNKILLETGHQCNGVIDYDIGFNKLICSKCGKEYTAKSLEEKIDQKIIILKGNEGDVDMKITLMKGDEVVTTIDSSKETETIVKPKHNTSEEMTTSLVETTDAKLLEIDLNEAVKNNVFGKEKEDISFNVSLGSRVISKNKNKRPNNNQYNRPNSNVSLESKFIPKKEEVKEEIKPEQVEEVKENVSIDTDVPAPIEEKEEVMFNPEEIANAIANNSISEEETEISKYNELSKGLGLDVEENNTEDSNIAKYYEQYNPDEVDNFEKIAKKEKDILDRF